MFVEFLYPLGLLAALGIGIPIAIHLWQVRKQRVLRVGNVNVFAKAKKQHVKKIRVKNWPLLVVRCAMILLLTAMLAGLHVNTDSMPEGARGWVLLGAQYQSLLDEAQRQLIDSLLAEHYTLHAFEPGFRRISLSNSDDTVALVADQFALIHQLNMLLPANFPVTVFSNAEISQLAGDIPTTPLKFSWHAFSDDTTYVARSIMRAWKTASDSVAALIGTSHSRATRFERLIIKGNGTEEGIHFHVEDGQAKVKFPEQREWVTVVERPLTVQFAVGNHPKDLTYVKAVLSAFEQQTSMQVKVDHYDPTVPCDILFDFTEGGVTDTTHRPKTMFRYMSGDVVVQQNNHIVQWDATTNGRNPAIYQLIMAKNDNAKVVWTDAYGRPVLTQNRDEHGWQYQFYCRFHPQWTDLVWSEAMVNNLLPLLLNPDAPLWVQTIRPYTMDRTTLPDTLPLRHQPKTVLNTVDTENQATATSLLTWLTLLTFAMERVMTYRQKKTQADG